jgi:alkylhydroperoxidase family enzyme
MSGPAVDRYTLLLTALKDAVVKARGSLDSAERKRLMGGTIQHGPLDELALLIREAPESVTDEHVKALLQSGHSEDAVFELIVCSAMAAGLARLRAGLEAFEGKR